MIIFKNFTSKNLYDLLNKKMSSINVENLEDIFDMTYVNKSTEDQECIPLRVHQESKIFYKAFFVDRKILSNFREEVAKNLSSYKSNEITFQFCIWNQGSYLDMHYDKIYKYGGTLYLNDFWEESWGGLFEYETKNKKVNVICPQKNLFVFNDCGEKHRVTPINLLATEKRKSIQVWMLD